MTKHIFYDSKLTIDSKSWVLENSEVEHIVKSFRMKIGNDIYLSNGEGLKFEAKIQEISKSAVSLLLEKSLETEKPGVTIIQGITKNENKETVQILSELGIKEYVPWLSNRSIHPDQKGMEKLVKSYTNYAIIGSKIARSAYVPKISMPLKTKEIIVKYNSGIVFSELENSKNTSSRTNKNTIVIGPEGGISKEEIKIFEENNWEIKSLGSRILSSKTASIKALISYL